MSLAEIPSPNFTIAEALQALGQVYEDAADQISRSTYAKLEHVQTALELRQQAFSNTLEKIVSGRFSQRHPTIYESVLASVRTTAYHLTLNHMRDRSTQKTSLFSDITRPTTGNTQETSLDSIGLPLFPTTDSEMGNPEDIYLAREEEITRREIVHTALAALGARVPEQPRILLLRYKEGLSADEISQVLGIPKSAVKSRLSRARQAFIRTYGQGI